MSGASRLELLAGDGVEQDLGRSGDGVERARDLRAGPALGVAGDVDRNRHVGAAQDHVVRHRIDEAAVDQHAPIQHDGLGEARQRSARRQRRDQWTGVQNHLLDGVEVGGDRQKAGF